MATAISTSPPRAKTGVHFFENLTINRVPKAQREKEILLDTNWPFPGEGPQVKQDKSRKSSEQGSKKANSPLYRARIPISLNESKK